MVYFGMLEENRLAWSWTLFFLCCRYYWPYWKSSRYHVGDFNELSMSFQNHRWHWWQLGGSEAFMTWHTTKDIRGLVLWKKFNGFQLLLFVAKMQGCKQTCFSLSKFKWKEIGEKIEKSIDELILVYQFPFE